MFYPQANFYPQPGFHPQTGANFYPQGSQAQSFLPQGLSPWSNWQQFAPQTPLQQQAIQQLLAQQQSMRQPGISGLNGMSNGAAQPGIWPQQQLGPEQFGQFSPAIPQQPYHHLLQQLAQYHHLVAQQLTQLAAQSAQGGAGAYPFAGQFIPNQLGTNFVSGITMH
jgi:hypothetical protein